MPTIRVEASPLGEAVETDEPAGGRLLDICDDSGAPIPFSCRSASCGTCRIEVLEGGPLLDEVSPGEQELLDLFADPPGRRLACVARVRAGTGLVRVRVTDD